MTDTPQAGGALPVESDDRLLAYVLGLEADPQLEAAAATDDVLRRRLDALRAEMARVAEQVARAVPEPDDTYTDLSQPRWATLRPRLEAEVRDIRPRVRRRDGASRWLRVLAPVAAVIVALAVGVSVLEHQNAGISSSLVDKAAPELAPTRSAGDTAATGQFVDRQAAADFGVVLIARARAVHDGFQRFDVVRVLRGAAPAQLRLRVASRPAELGLLHVLYLSPVATEAGGTGLTPSADSPSPAPSPEPSETGGGAGPSPAAAGSADEILFDDGGETAVAVQMPVGVDPSDVFLP
jgi:hypothetical protein